MLAYFAENEKRVVDVLTLQATRAKARQACERKPQAGSLLASCKDTSLPMLKAKQASKQALFAAAAVTSVGAP